MSIRMHEYNVHEYMSLPEKIYTKRELNYVSASAFLLQQVSSADSTTSLLPLSLSAHPKQLVIQIIKMDHGAMPSS